MHNDPSKIGLQPLPWQLVDKLKNWRQGSLDGWEVRRMLGWAGDCSEKWPGIQSFKGRAQALNS